MATPKSVEARIHNTLPVAREGLPFIFVAFVVSILFLILNFILLGLLAGALCIFTIYFFRDPERSQDVTDNAVLTPADGRVLGVQTLADEDNPLKAPAKKISIFMSVFNVHVNRIPISGRISNIAYYPGKFLSANLDKASKENENNRITLETKRGQRIVFVQIAGLIARRIACWVKEGYDVEVGQRFGLIRFGSRLDIYLPVESNLLVDKGNRVKAGKTILGYLP